MMRPGPEWLARFQRDFGATLRAPLDRATGTLVAQPARYPQAIASAIVGDRERLAVYNRQYWFRLFGVFHHELPLTTTICGAWGMNGLAARFLDAHPPHARDLAHAVDGFDRFALDQVGAAGLGVAPGAPRVPRDVLAQALAIDLAFRACISAPQQRQLVLIGVAPARLAVGRLRPSTAHALVDEDRALVALRQDGVAGSRPAPLPPHHVDGPVTWLIARTSGGLRVLPVARGPATLWRLLALPPVGEALARFERDHAHLASDTLALSTQRWLAEGARLELWTDLDA